MIVATEHTIKCKECGEPLYKCICRAVEDFFKKIKGKVNK